VLSDDTEETALRIPLQHLSAVLYGSLLVLALLGFGLEYLSFQLQEADFGCDLRLTCEASLPTWYVSLLLSGCAALLAILARRGGPMSGRWWLLSGAFLYISIDETVTIHEALNEPLRELLGFRGVLFYGWVVPFGAMTVAVALYCLPLLRSLPGKRARAFVIAGAIYVGGALGTELPLSWLWDAFGYSLTYGFLNVTQECLEILGVTHFFLALCAHLSCLTLRLTEGPGA
jgi:hypothetical protein